MDIAVVALFLVSAILVQEAPAASLPSPVSMKHISNSLAPDRPHGSGNLLVNQNPSFSDIPHEEPGGIRSPQIRSSSSRSIDDGWRSKGRFEQSTVQGWTPLQPAASPEGQRLEQGDPGLGFRNQRREKSLTDAASLVRPLPSLTPDNLNENHPQTREEKFRPSPPFGNQKSRQIQPSSSAGQSLIPSFRNKELFSRNGERGHLNTHAILRVQDKTPFQSQIQPQLSLSTTKSLGPLQTLSRPSIENGNKDLFQFGFPSEKSNKNQVLPNIPPGNPSELHRSSMLSRPNPNENQFISHHIEGGHGVSQQTQVPENSQSGRIPGEQEQHRLLSTAFFQNPGKINGRSGGLPRSLQAGSLASISSSGTQGQIQDLSGLFVNQPETQSRSSVNQEQIQHVLGDLPNNLRGDHSDFTSSSGIQGQIQGHSRGFSGNPRLSPSNFAGSSGSQIQIQGHTGGFSENPLKQSISISHESQNQFLQNSALRSFKQNQGGSHGPSTDQAGRQRQNRRRPIKSDLRGDNQVEVQVKFNPSHSRQSNRPLSSQAQRQRQPSPLFGNRRQNQLQMSRVSHVFQGQNRLQSTSNSVSRGQDRLSSRFYPHRHHQRHLSSHTHARASLLQNATLSLIQQGLARFRDQSQLHRYLRGLLRAQAGPLNLPAGSSLILDGINSPFECADQPFGYYADQRNSCKVFHICYPALFSDRHIETFQYSFMCAEGSVFDQKKMTCVQESAALPCQEASNYFFRNEEFGLPEEKVI